MSTETTNDYGKYFLLSDEGVLSLQPAYRGEGNSAYPFSLRGGEEPASDFPEILEIPTAIGETQVTSLAPGMFYGNTRVKEIKLLVTVATIPEAFCCEAANLEAIDVNGVITTIGKDAFKSTKIKEALFPDVTTLYEGAFSGCTCLEVADISGVSEIPMDTFNGCTLLREVSTGEVTSIGSAAFNKTRIRQALFSKLTTLGAGAFLWCGYLEVADIGEVTEIPEAAFANCALLREVIWKAKEVGEGEKVKVTIGPRAFYQTRSLEKIPFLSSANAVGQGAFYYSKFNGYTVPADCVTDATAFPTSDNETEFWTGVASATCKNRIITKLSQNNSEWLEKAFLLNDGTKYGSSCALFAVMHIHSAITGKNYMHPDEFVNELRADPKLSKYLYENNWPGKFENTASLFEALGHRTEVHGNGSDLSQQNFQDMLDALADGAYVYTQVGTFEYQEDGSAAYYPNNGHAVVIYGINNSNPLEVCVLDSNVLHEHYREDGFEPDVDVYTYTMPYQNMVGPSSDFIIVYPRKEEPVVEWKGFADANTFTSASLPSEYPENQVTVCRVVNDTGMPYSTQGILTAYRVGTNAYRTFMPYSKAALYLQIRSSTEDRWLDWTECNRKDFTKLSNNAIYSTTKPLSLPTGVNVSTISSEGDLERLPEGKKGYLTAYNLFSSAANAREEWQPIGSAKKYIRYATGEETWSDWLDIIPSFTVNMINNQNQYQADKTIEKILAAVNAGASVRCDVNIGGIRYLLPLAAINSDENQTELVYGLNMGVKQAEVKQRDNSVTVSLT